MRHDATPEEQRLLTHLIRRITPAFTGRDVGSRRCEMTRWTDPIFDVFDAEDAFRTTPSEEEMQQIWDLREHDRVSLRIEATFREVTLTMNQAHDFWGWLFASYGVR